MTTRSSRDVSNGSRGLAAGARNVIQRRCVEHGLPIRRRALARCRRARGRVGVGHPRITSENSGKRMVRRGVTRATRQQWTAYSGETSGDRGAASECGRDELPVDGLCPITPVT